MTEKAPKLIDANTAALRLAKVFGGKRNAKSALADYLRDGDLDAWAGLYWREEDDAGRFVPTPSEEGMEKDVKLNRLDWWSSKRWTKDQESWSWRAGVFRLTIGNKPRRYVRIKGLRFRLDQIDRLYGAGTPTASRGGGPKPHQEKWAAFGVCLVKSANTGHFSKGRFPNYTSLRDAILLEVENEALEDASLNYVVKVLYERFCI